MKGDKKMITLCFILGMVGVLLIAASLVLALTGCGKAGGETPTLRTQGTEAPAPGEITRIKLVEGLTIRNVDMVRPEGIEYILSMLDVDTYELVDSEDERALEVYDKASTVLEFFAGDELYGTAFVTNGCEVVVAISDGIIEGGGVWYTVTSKVDTVLITAEFGRKP